MIVVDTHAWLWLLAAPDRLSPDAAEAIGEADAIGVSAMSCWEIGMLETCGRIGLSLPPLEWIRAALAQEGTTALPADAEVAAAAALLSQDELPGDPVNHIIYATALAHDAKLVTKDAALRAHDPRGTVW